MHREWDGSVPTLYIKWQDAVNLSGLLKKNIEVQSRCRAPWVLHLLCIFLWQSGISAIKFDIFYSEFCFRIMGELLCERTYFIGYGDFGNVYRIACLSCSSFFLYIFLGYLEKSLKNLKNFLKVSSIFWKLMYN